jgi:hypothetical protein
MFVGLERSRMKMLTTLLLADAVKKGGPGGGPHPNPGSASRSANLKSKIANASDKKSDHLAAAAAHQLASKKHLAAGNFKTAALHAGKAGVHEEAAKS